MLKNLIRDELRSSGPVKLTHDIIEGVLEEVNDTFKWCLSSKYPQVCPRFKEVFRKFLDNYYSLRLGKSLSDGVPKGSVDSPFLEAVIEAVRRYYELVFKGLVGHDEKVFVRVIKDAEVGGRKLTAGTATSLELVAAILLELLGVVRIIDASPTLTP